MYIIIANKKYKVNYMNTFYKRFTGLMFKKEKITDIYLFPRCNSIHTYFMKQNIDICILDKNYNVVFKMENLKPSKILIKKGYYTLEMPLGTAKHIKIGDNIKISTD